LKKSKIDCFSKVEDSLIKRITEKNEKEKIYSSTKTKNDLDNCKNARRKDKKAIKTAKNNWIKEEITKLPNLNMDPYTA